MANKKTAQKSQSKKSDSKGFSAEEKAAMRERAREAKKEQSESDVLVKIAEMDDSDRAIGERIHQLIKENAPTLAPKTWYGMPSYAKDGKVVCFFQSAGKFKSRYPTLGFNDSANLDDGSMWPVAFALTKLTTANEKKIVSLVKKAVA